MSKAYAKADTRELLDVASARSRLLLLLFFSPTGSSVAAPA